MRACTLRRNCSATTERGSMNEDLAPAGTQVSACHCSLLLPVPPSKVPSAMWPSRISRVHHGRDSVYGPCRLSNLSSKCLKTLKVHVGYTEIQAMRKSDKLTWSESSCAQMVKLKPTFFHQLLCTTGRVHTPSTEPEGTSAAQGPGALTAAGRGSGKSCRPAC